MYKVGNNSHRQRIYAEKKFKKELNRRRSHNGRVLSRNLRIAKKEAAKTIDPPRTLRLAPENFSMLDNLQEVTQYFQSVKSLLEANEHTRMDLSKIKNIDLPTLCMLSAFMLDSRTNAPYLYVVGPNRTSKAHEMFEAAQFERMIIAKKRVDFNSGAFLSKSDKNVNGPYIQSVLDKTVAFFGARNRKKLNNLHPIIVEIVTNTSNHADPDEKNTIPWIINTYETIRDGKKIKQYCMIDLGIGIYESMYDKTEQWKRKNKKLRSWMNDMSGSSQNGFFSSHIPIGIQSATALPQRGKGVKFIYDTVTGDNMYKRFEIITNKAHVDLINIGKIKKDTASSLSATIYYWEISLE